VRFDSYEHYSVANYGYQTGYDYQYPGGILGRYYQPHQQQPEENELATKILTVESKRFFVDVKENRIGRFIKISQVPFVYSPGLFAFIFDSVSTAAGIARNAQVANDVLGRRGARARPALLDCTRLRVQVAAVRREGQPPD
jgi:hypothetical protein